MADYRDAKHRPHAVHTGETPQNPITYGPESLSVTLDRWGPQESLFTSMYDALQANWGDSPSRTVDRVSHPGDYGGAFTFTPPDARVPNAVVAQRTGWVLLEPNERDYVESCFAGKTLQQVLEGVTFDFCIDGVSRAFTHQNVRTRLGAGFMQHGGRDNDWRHRAWTMPETMRRMCEVMESQAGEIPDSDDVGLKHCITDWVPIDKYLTHDYALDVDDAHIVGDIGKQRSIRNAIEDHIMNGRKLYAALVDAGIPWQDARRVLFMGMQTYIHDQYNYLALQGVLANRLEHIMDYEFNAVAQLMLREVKMKCPPLISKYLGSHSDKAKQAKFAGLESWPPDRKYPSPYDICQLCAHAGGNHRIYVPAPGDEFRAPGEHICSVCEREGDMATHAPLHKYVPVDTLKRQHRPEQMPYFVLAPSSYAGGPIIWFPTNGSFPWDEVHADMEANGLKDIYGSR